MEKDIYKLELHEEINIDNYTSVMRVPGGWIYTLRTINDCYNSIFVPFNYEFMKR